MSAEAIVLLRSALRSAGGQPAKQQAAIERLQQIRRRSRLPAGEPPSEELVREDRDQAG